MRLPRRFTLLILAAMSMARAADSVPPSQTYGLVLHGGAGVIDRRNLTPEKEAELRATLTAAREAGYAVLQRGGAALDAVIATVMVLEDSPLFNAGKGAVFNHEGICELDAAVMEGRTQAAGAIAGVHRIRNPITLARAVMEKSSHVLLSGAGAEQFAAQQGFAFVPNEYFQTEARRRQWEQARQREAGSKTSAIEFPDSAQVDRTGRYGTVGCVALDQAGNLAAGTSTGGMTNKKFGRIGDAPLIGAGTYAHNATCAVSATGWGEFFIRVGVARDIAAQVEYRGTPLAEAAAATLAKVRALGGDGGVICLDRRGNIAAPFNSPGMYRAHRLSDGRAGVAMYAEER